MICKPRWLGQMCVFQNITLAPKQNRDLVSDRIQCVTRDVVLASQGRSVQLENSKQCVAWKLRNTRYRNISLFHVYINIC